MFLHGWGGGYESFAGCVGIMKNKFRCVSLDFFDCEPARPLTLDDYADFTKKALRAYGVGDCVLIGHSFGGRVAMRLAAKGIGSKLILTDAAGMKSRRGLKYYARLYRYRIKKFFGADTSDCGSPDYRALSPVMKATFNNIVRTYQEKDAENISVPTLLVWGAKDKDTPLYMAKKLKHLLKDSGTVVFDNAAHFAYLEEHTRFCAIVESFAKSQEGVCGGYPRSSYR